MMSDGANALYLATAPVAEDLRGKSVRGGAAVALTQAVQFGLGLASTMVLARLLTPADFGVIAMVAAFSSFLLLFQDLGLGLVTVQRADLSHGQVSALFWINAGLGLLISGMMAASSPLVARFYAHPELVGVTLALSANFALGGLSVQHNALLRRQMRFVALGVVSVVSQALGIAAAIGSALAGAGYWALVVMALVQQAAAAAGAWIVCGWKPGWPQRWVGLGSMLRFGAGLTGFNLLTTLSRNLDNILIGRAAGAATLGLYQKSYSLLLMPVDRIRGPASAVVVPALSRLQHDPDRFKAYYLGAIRMVVAAGMPAVVFLFVFANDVVLLVLGGQWLDSVVLFRLLAPAAFVETFNTVGSWACVPMGRSARLVRWQAIATPVMVLSFLVGVRWGASGVAIAVSLTTVALRLPAILYMLKGSPVRPADLLIALARPAFASISAGAVLFALHLRVPAVTLALMLVAVVVFGALYLAIWILLPGGRADVRQLTHAWQGLLTTRGGRLQEPDR